MSTTNTNYIVNNSSLNTQTDLINIFQINPLGYGTNVLPPPYTITGSGGATVQYNSGWYVLKFNTGSSSISIDSSITTIYALVVGGGGSGGGGIGASTYSSSGGNGGSVIHVSFTNPGANVDVSVGSGGAAAAFGNNGSPGNNSQLTISTSTIKAPGGQGGVTGNYWPSGQSACTVSSGITLYYQTPENTITGGNSAVQKVPDRISAGNNGYGAFIPTNSINLSYFGGGGGGCSSYIGGTFQTDSPGNGGLGGGGNGGYNYGEAPSYPFVSVGNGINGTGGGGGGGVEAYDPSKSVGGGSGGDGVVIIYFQYPI